MLLRLVRCVLLIVGVSLLVNRAGDCARAGNLVCNSSFEQDNDQNGIPDDWQTSGRREIEQSLHRDAGRDRRFAVRLDCTRFEGGTPDSHAMICQTGKVAVRKGQWYRIRLWVKGRDLAKPACQIAISNTKPWQSSGVSGQFVPTESWRLIEILSQATRDVPAETSRLQIWFGSTGTLWLDDVSIEPVAMVRELHPTIAAAAAANPIPNSSFECGRAGWGSYSPSITTWAGNLYRLYGTIDTGNAFHGDASLRVTVDKSDPAVFRWDYYDPAVQPITAVLAANVGWIRTVRGRRYVLSCYLRADRADTPARLLVYQDTGGRRDKLVRVSTQWQRYTLPLTAGGSHAWCAVGPDLGGAEQPRATVWIDAVQLDTGSTTQPYRPRAAVESGLTTSATGGIFQDPNAGIATTIHIWNGTPTEKSVAGHLIATDFFDREVLRMRMSTQVAARASHSFHLTGLLRHKRGFFRIEWQPLDHAAPYSQTLRCALLEPYAHSESPFGMNHAYPWDFMLRLCKTAGLTWMRDWSAKWHTVQPEPTKWDFAKVDPQIDRIVTCGQNPLVLLPFASAPWCSSAKMDVICKALGADDYRVTRSIVACPATDAKLFRQYVEHTVRRYRDRARWFEIMNEPLYTTYAVPARFGYTMNDYLHILQAAHRTIKQVDEHLQVIGGIGTWPDNQWVQQFIDADGLQWCDVMDVHLYPVTMPPELYEPGLIETEKKMRARKQFKPIWLTEFGCYADDDPYSTPSTIGDSAMSRSNWPSEQAAAEALVKSSAVFLSHNIHKIFFHAGTCGPINGNDGGGIFFEYGGTPRKMLAALSVLANMLGPHPRALTATGLGKHYCHYVFATDAHAVAIVWTRDDHKRPVVLPDDVQAIDIMGNLMVGRKYTLTATPVYLRAVDAQRLQRWLDTGLTTTEP